MQAPMEEQPCHPAECFVEEVWMEPPALETVEEEHFTLATTLLLFWVLSALVRSIAIPPLFIRGWILSCPGYCQ